MDAEVLARVEEQRLNLEDNIAKLRKSLRHWQTLEVDYEGLKEEFLGLDGTSTSAECLQAAKDFKPELVDEKELENIIRDKSPLQVVDLLTKRTDYVSRNVETVRNQLSVAQKQWNALVLAEDPEHRDEAALPLKEVIEEIDDQGNVISSTVKAPSNDTSNLVDVLRQAGVPDLPKAEVQPTNPDDTEEEAQLRQEMLQYGLGEVGQIVAELELDHDSDSDSDNYSDESEDERGATKNPVISDRYRQQMEALEAKLGIKNHGPRPPAAEAARKAAIARDEATKEDETLKRSRKVAFAEELDIAPKPEEPEIMTDTLVEREAATSSDDTCATSPRIFADTLVERPASRKASAPDSLDFDEELHRREIATEYQKLRNRKIHEQGGYVGGGEQDNYGDEVKHETVEDGKPKKVSRFKAARIKS